VDLGEPPRDRERQLRAGTKAGVPRQRAVHGDLRRRWQVVVRDTRTGELDCPRCILAVDDEFL
jgi:hypothetical protein